MEFALRLLVYVALGLVLLVANVWFVRTIHKNFFSAELIVAPFRVIDPSGRAGTDKTGEALAQMMAARLGDIQAQLRATLPATGERPDVPNDADARLGATALFITRPVDVPASLFEPVDIQATVGGVEVGGIIAWLQRTLAAQRALTFTTYDRGERAVITADLGGLFPKAARLWFESDRQPDEIATNAAYALIQLKLAEKRTGRIRELELADFRSLLETVFRVDAFNRRALRGYVVDDEFAALLPSVETLTQTVTRWPELVYLTASIADGAGNHAKAADYYRRVTELRDGAPPSSDPRVFDWAAERLAALGSPADPPAAEREERFVGAADEFARRMGLTGANPRIAFVDPQKPGVQAIWNRDERRYEVNPANADTPGLPQYVALMGRFMDRNFDRCFGDGMVARGAATTFWNEFRHSLVGYLIQTEPEFGGVTNIGSQQALFRAFKEMETLAGAEPVKRLALELLERYDCDWTGEMLAEQMLTVNDERGLLSRDVILQAMRSHDFAPSGKEE